MIPLYRYMIPLYRYMIPLYRYMIPLYRYMIPLYRYMIPLFRYMFPLFRYMIPPFQYLIPLFRYLIPLFQYMIPPFMNTNQLYSYMIPLIKDRLLPKNITHDSSLPGTVSVTMHPASANRFELLKSVAVSRHERSCRKHMVIPPLNNAEKAVLPGMIIVKLPWCNLFRKNGTGCINNFRYSPCQ